MDLAIPRTALGTALPLTSRCQQPPPGAFSMCALSVDACPGSEPTPATPPRGPPGHTPVPLLQRLPWDPELCVPTANIPSMGTFRVGDEEQHLPEQLFPLDRPAARTPESAASPLKGALPSPRPRGQQGFRDPVSPVRGLSWPHLGTERTASLLSVHNVQAVLRPSWGPLWCPGTSNDPEMPLPPPGKPQDQRSTAWTWACECRTGEPSGLGARPRHSLVRTPWRPRSGVHPGSGQDATHTPSRSAPFCGQAQGAHSTGEGDGCWPFPRGEGQLRSRFAPGNVLA